MLTRLHVQGYKALRDVSVTFEPLTVIVGPNGCGKTSVLQAIELIPQLLSRRELEPELPSAEIFSRGAGSEPEIVARLSTTHQSDSAGIPSIPNPRSDVSVDSLGDDGLLVSLTLRSKRLFGHGLDVRTRLLVANQLPTIRRLRPNIDAMASPSHLPEASPYVRDDGAGLATVLNWLLGERDDRFAEIEQRLQEFVPEVRRIRTRRVPMRVVEPVDVKIGTDDHGQDVFEKRSYKQERTGHQVVVDFEHADGVPAPHLSEGTLLLLGLLTTVVTGKASVLLLDDIERGLHPKTQQQLIAYLAKMAEQGTQIIATSHSPYLLLHLDYDQVRAMTLAGAEGSKIGKLTDHPEFERWKDEMSPGEFWTVFGESWLHEHQADG